MNSENAKAIQRLEEDPRIVHKIEWADGARTCSAEVGFGGIKGIVPYLENGQMAGVPWFAIMAVDTEQEEVLRVASKINGAFVIEVDYKGTDATL